MQHPVFSDWKESNNIEDFIKSVCTSDLPIIKNGNYEFYNVAAAFDIETTSFVSTRMEKCGIMYAWTLGIGRNIILGRTWEDFISICNMLRKTLNLSNVKRLIIYVHNLPYEFQFFRKWFVWDKVFAVDKRKPVYAITDGIEFRCSYILSGLSLANVAKSLKFHTIQKLTGDLNYSLLRHTHTPLTDAEKSYCLHDVIIVIYYIEETMQKDGNIAKIPLTKTGYVRRFCRDACFKGIDGKSYWKRKKYREYISKLTLEPDEYLQLKRAFMGGFTHANSFIVDKVIDDVTSYDFTSAYPAVMIAEQFPIEKAEKVEIKSKEQLEKCLKYYCCLFDCRFEKLTHKIKYEHYISRSRCFGVKGDVCDNGRIVKAEELFTTITEQDFMIIRDMYTWKNCEIYNFRRYKKGYLPTDFVKAILKLYHDKTVLKGVEGMEDIYMLSKAMLNSAYGMICTDIVREVHEYKWDWKDSAPNLSDEIRKYNADKNRFLFFPWGVWVTAYCRRNLYTAILLVGTDYCYSDTDSVKVVNADAHKEYFEKYNSIITNKVQKALKYHGIDFDEAIPKTQDGIPKMLGVWDFDGQYAHFKSLGAKRYLTQDYNGNYKMTVAGLGKEAGLEYLLDEYGDELFDAFTQGLYVPKGKTGKMIHSYIDTPRRGIITDYLGESCDYMELSAVHLDEADYTLDFSESFVKYLKGVWG